MPRPQSSDLRQAIPIRFLAIFTSVLLVVPNIPAETIQAKNQIHGAYFDAMPRRDVIASATSPVETQPPNPPQNQQQPTPTNLTCAPDADTELNSDFVLPTRRTSEADTWGDIRIAQPKIWQFERVSALLDGLLRDVEGISLGDVTQLDPSQQNAAALKFIQSALEVGVQYDQAAAVNNANTLSNYNELHAAQSQQLQQYNNYMQTLTSERDRLAAQYAASSNEVNSLTALKAAGPLTDTQTKQLEEAASRQATTQASLASVNSLISGAGAAPTLTAPPTVTGTSVQGPASGSPMSSTLSGFSDVLKNLPDGVQKNLSAALQSPSYPATKRLDNFITLLYERLAREISVLQDDLTRDPENVAFLLQFDVSLYPSKKAKDHVARVEFDLDCPGCKVYSLYPGQSSYNLANYSGSSKRTTLWGNVLTLFGFGVSASYRRQTDMLQGSLVQSVYTSGFQNGVLSEPQGAPIHTGDRIDANKAEQSFGWYYGAAPFEQVVTPGIRTTFAMITVPRTLIRKSQDRFGNTNACVPFHINAGWSNRNDPLAQDSFTSPVGHVVKQARVPFYYPHRDELNSSSAPPAPNNPTCGSDRTITCNPNSNPSCSPPSCTTRPAPTNPSVIRAETSVKLPASSEGFSLVGAREKQKLHVIRMEYDTVYEDSEAASSATAIKTVVQTSTQSTNSATGQTTGQTTSQTTGSSVAVSNSSTSPTAPDPSAALNPLPCPKFKCAPVLLTLDHPIDPNLTVTVRGNPLQRVRDWRGRATSLLPPAQSGSDLTGAAAASGSLSLKQLAQSRGLTEIDQFGPNTWFPLNSHELLLNISIDVAQDYEFPLIQLADPSGSVVIPHDLRKSFTELIVNSLRMRPETQRGIQTEVARQNWRDVDDGPECPNGGPPASQCFLSATDAPISTGMYPFATYSPLFSPQPAARRFYAYMGETGEDLLIGFLPELPTQKATDKTAHFDWGSAQARVVLEDRSQDFAWSLSCDVQGSLLACRIPRSEIKSVYQNFLRACPDSTACPGIEEEYRSLIQSLANSPTFMTHAEFPAQNDVLPAKSRHDLTQKESLLRVKASLDETSGFSLSDSRNTDAITTNAKKDQKTATTSAALLQRQNLQDFRNAFLKTMQVWVEQFDEEEKNVFYSPEPASLGFFPVSDDYWRFGPFTPWGYQSADRNRVTLRECNYLPQTIIGRPGKLVSTQKEIYAELLGVSGWKDWLLPHPNESKKQPNIITGRPSWTYLDNENDTEEDHCGTLSLPTSALANNPIVIQMEFPPHPDPSIPASYANPPIRTTVTIPRSRVAPHFIESGIRVYYISKPTPANKKLTPDEKRWRIVIPVERLTCFDTLDLGPYLQSHPKISFAWFNGNNPLTPCPSNANAESEWRNAAQSGHIDLWIELPHSAIPDLPESVRVIRTTSGGVGWEVASLTNLKQLLLPPRVTIKQLSPTMYAVIGEHAEVIDHVTLQNEADDSFASIDTIPGRDYALFSISPPSSSGGDKPDSSGNSPAGTNSTTIDVSTTKDQAATVKLTQIAGSAKSTTTTPATKTPPATTTTKTTSTTDSKPAAVKALTPGTYAVVSMMELGNGPASDKQIQDMKAAEQDANTARADAIKARRQAEASEKAVEDAKKNAAKPPAAPAPAAGQQAGAASPAGNQPPAQPAVTPAANPPTPDDKSKAGGDKKKAPPAKEGAAGPNRGGAAQPQPPQQGAPPAKSKEQELATKAAADKKNAETASENAKNKVQAWQAAIAAAAKGSPTYMPLDVTDKDGKPLTLTIPETKKNTTTSGTAPAAAACVPSCAALTCAATCPPTATGPASSKNP